MKSINDYVNEISAILKYMENETIKSAIALAQVPESLIEIVARQCGTPFTLSEPVLFSAPENDAEKISLKQDGELFQTLSLLGYLQNTRKWSMPVTQNLVHSSKKILRNFPDPLKTNEFSCKGLVVGYVQSGKTASMTSLTSLAVDHGYKIIIVLSGLLNDLRVQTQKRFDEELTGISEIAAESERVTNIKGTKHWVRLTKSTIDDDFSAGSVDFDPAGESIKLAIIKKMPSRINALKDWLKTADLSNHPALIIDDESDHASIDTNYQVDDEGDDEISPSTTNKAIRELLAIFPKSTYVGYTATPFANFFIDADVLEDLYPRDFICFLDEPPTYIGARKLFGLGLSASYLHPEDPFEAELNLIEEIDTKKLDKNPSPDKCPSFLDKAIKCFLLSSAARMCRGHNGKNDHFSMLVHPSHTVGNQSTYTQVIKTWVTKNQNTFSQENPRYLDKIKNELKTIWEEDFVPLTKKAIEEQLCDETHDEFEKVFKKCKDVITQIEIKLLNSGSADSLDYSNGRKIYIVIGGNKLSRGLTLEGLSVSVYFRTMPNAYDTALQMARWFGYRNGYLDLTRIFVEKKTQTLFSMLARIELELREDLKKYIDVENPPRPIDVFPMIRKHPSMAITSKLKQGAATEVTFSYQNTKVQTIVFPVKETEQLKANVKLAMNFIEGLPNRQKSSSKPGTHYFKDVSVESIIKFINDYNFATTAYSANSTSLIQYIEAQNKFGELTKWDVILPAGAQKNPCFKWSEDISTNMVWRSRFKRSIEDINASIKVLSDPEDLKLWRTELKRSPSDKTIGGIFLYILDSNSYDSDPDKNIFASVGAEPTNIVGVVIDFPVSKSNATIVYTSQGNII